MRVQMASRRRRTLKAVSILCVVCIVVILYTQALYISSLDEVVSRESFLKPEWWIIGPNDYAANTVIYSMYVPGQSSKGTPGFAEISFQNKLVYAQQHRYHFVYATDMPDSTRHVHWGKVPGLRALQLKGYEYIVWIDMDILVVQWCQGIPEMLNATTQQPVDMLIQRDFHHPMQQINTGLYVLRTTPFTIRLLERWYAEESVFRYWASKFGSLAEQDAADRIIFGLDPAMQKAHISMVTHPTLWALGTVDNIDAWERGVRGINACAQKLAFKWDRMCPFSFHWAGRPDKGLLKEMLNVWKAVHLNMAANNHKCD